MSHSGTSWAGAHCNLGRVQLVWATDDASFSSVVHTHTDTQFLLRVINDGEIEANYTLLIITT